MKDHLKMIIKPPSTKRQKLNIIDANNNGKIQHEINSEINHSLYQASNNNKDIDFGDKSFKLNIHCESASILYLDPMYEYIHP